MNRQAKKLRNMAKVPGSFFARNLSEKSVPRRKPLKLFHIVIQKRVPYSSKQKENHTVSLIFLSSFFFFFEVIGSFSQPSFFFVRDPRDNDLILESRSHGEAKVSAQMLA